MLLPGTEKVIYSKKSGTHKLVGTVSFTYQKNTMYCDSAYYNERRHEVRAYGNVHILKDGINLYCDSMYYNGNQKKGMLWSHVTVRDMEYKLTTDSLEYRAEKGQAIYRNWGRIESSTSNELLTSKVGYMYPQSKNMFFSQQVNYKKDELTISTDTLQFNYSKQKTFFYGPTTIRQKETKMRCERGWYTIKTEEGCLMRQASIDDPNKFVSGDTLYHHGKLKKSIGQGHVFYKDKTSGNEFSGNLALNDELKGFTLLTGKPLVKKIQQKDTLYIAADTIKNLLDGKGKTQLTQCYNHTMLYSNTLQAKCDSLIFKEKDSIIQLFTQPIVWTGNTELKGKKIDIHLQDTLINRIIVSEQASVAMEVEPGSYYNQLSGKTITNYFEQNKLHHAVINGNAKTIYFPVEEQKNDTSVVLKRLGMNKLLCSRMTVYLDSGEVKSITYFEEPEGYFYPIEQLQEKDKYLENFSWTAALRPKNWKHLRNQTK